MPYLKTNMLWLFQITPTGFRLRFSGYGETWRDDPRFDALLED